jgi:thymidylate synthase|tara:strand:+ start:934 stop:1764 length:831 start_codon:yes stop_codon:yes gene_type:complete
MISIQEEYRGLLSGILYGGKQKSDRTGTGTLSIFGRSIKHDMALGFPLLTTKKVYFNHAITELLWILQGRTDIKYLHKHNVSYWDPDYERSGRTDGTLGKIYGTQWRNFNGFDQLLYIIDNLKKNPSSRRLLLNSWNPADFNDMALPPCHYGFQVYVNNNKLDLIWQQRSADVFLGLPYDIAMYGLLILLLCKEFNFTPGILTGQLGDCHLYNNHLDQAKLQLSRDFKTLPVVEVKKGLKIVNNKNIFIPCHKDIILKEYNPHNPIKAPLSVGDNN